MAKEIKKVIVTDKTDKVRKAAPQAAQPVEMLFKRINYTLILVGVLLIVVGFILMAGGKMPSADVWDETLIYDPVKILVSPIVILAGLVVIIVAIFKK
jgi:hypothetical protein